MRTSQNLLLAAMLCAPSGATEARVYPPIERLVLNQIVGAAASTNTPFYLPKRGRYYAEIIREGNTDGLPPQVVDLTVRVMRDAKLLFEKHVQQTLAADTAGATLFWLNSPSDVPDRHELTVTVATNIPLTAPLRLQITRKYEGLPIFVR